MKLNTEARFYDGKTSMPQNIEVFLDFKQNKLDFIINNKSNIWKFKDINFIKKSDTIICQYGSDTIQQIYISDPQQIKKIKSLLKNQKQTNWHNHLIELGFKAHTVIALLILAMIVSSYFYVIPWLGEKAVTILPESYDDEIGNVVFDQIVAKDKVDEKKTNFLNAFANKLDFENKKKLHFTVIDSEIVNAFALPDGNIVVYTGILEKMQNYEELVALLGHEAAHVNNRHSMKSMCRDLSGYFFISALLGDANGIIAILGEHANNLQSLSYSREFEAQSDEEGYKTMIKNNVNPSGMIDLFKRLKSEEKEIGISIPEFLSSHPLTEERIKNAQTRLKNNNYNFKQNESLKVIFNELKN